MRIVHHDGAAVGLDDLIDDGGQRGHELKIELPLEALLDDLHMQHAQEAAAEAEAEGDGALRLKAQGSVVELELFQRVAQIRVLGAVLGVDPAEDHRTRGAVAGQGLGGRAQRSGDGVAHLRVGYVLDARREIADVARGKLAAGVEADGAQMPQFHNLVFRAGGHEQDLVLASQSPVDHAHEDDDTAVIVILAVENKGLEGRLGIAGGCGDLCHDVLKHGVNVDAGLGGDLRRVLGRNTDDLLDLLLDALRVCRGQVDLVDNGQDLQIVVKGEIGVREGLRFDSLARVHNEDRAFAGGERAADLIVEVHMARGIDEVEGIVLPRGRVIGQTDGARLDGDAALPFEIHVVEDLILHDALLYRAAFLDEAVGERGFAVVDMGNDAEIADILLIDHSAFTSRLSSAASARSSAPRTSRRKARDWLRLRSPG